MKLMRRRTRSPTSTSIDPARTFTAALSAVALRDLGIGVSIWSDGVWRPIHAPDSIVEFEVALGAELPRWSHNERAINKARTTLRPVLAEHAGFSDLFVPIIVGSRADAVLIAGPFARERPSSAGVSERWYEIAHARASMSDPRFSAYLAATFATLTLEGPLLGAFRALIGCLSRALGGQGDAGKLARQWNALIEKLLLARSAERMWEVARSMVDERTAARWWTPIMRDSLLRIGLKAPPGHVVVGLLRGRPDEADPIDEALRRDAFQRAATGLTRAWGALTCGKVGDHGIVLLASGASKGARARAALFELAARASQGARRFGLWMHAGIALGSGSQSLADRYRAALAAADRAFSRGEATALAQDSVEPSGRTLTQLRTGLASGLEERPDLVLARFERYVEAVLAHAGYQAESIRTHLEVGVERLAEPWLASGALDPKDFEELRAPVAKASVESVTQLVATYRAVVAHLERAVQNPTVARQGRSVERALEFMRQHLGEPLSLPQVAKIARFAPSHFARLLRREQGMPFERHLLLLRIERAKHMLTSTPLHVRRIAERCGFKSRTHFQQVFKKQTGETPMAYRERTRA
jgi:AraC-like DNA-binding protein